ncbi:MAG: ribosomal protein S18-alanine N-acetyltransferase [Firmicutes bacterium]|nr:ribosomal protein S18-alanine N-acetyltransferase [Bacillota bacterium]
MADLIIRKAEEKDILQIEELEKICFADPWSYESLEQDILRNKLAFYIVAEVDGEVCGYVGIWNIVDEGHITNVAVSPDFRRMHIASNMLDVLIASCEAAGVERFTLEVRAGNEPAKALYAGKGFREMGIRKGYYQDNGEDAIIMWRE